MQVGDVKPFQSYHRGVERLKVTGLHECVNPKVVICLYLTDEMSLFALTTVKVSSTEPLM